MTDGAAGLAVGLATGYVIGSENQKVRNRRLSHIDSDQLLLKVKTEKDKVGTVLANCFSNWKYSDGEIIETHKIPINFVSFVLSLMLFVFVFWVIGTFFNVVILQSSINILVIGVIISIIIGYLRHSNVVPIKLGRINKFTTVTIKIFDNDGYRIFDKDEILMLVETLENLYKGKKEVIDSLNSQKF